MKKFVTIFLYLFFVLLCGAQILPKFMAEAKKEKGAVLYVRSADRPMVAKKAETKEKNYQELVKGINVNGA